MKILYGINSNGQGHINRSRVFITQLLEDGHEVHVFLAGREPPKYAYDLVPNVMFERGPFGVYENNQISVFKTLFRNLKYVRSYFKTIRKLRRKVRKENFDAIFSDLEPITSRAGRTLKKPVIGIDRQHAIFHPKMEITKGRLIDKIITVLTTKLLFPYYNYCFAIDFVEDFHKSRKITLSPPVWKQEFDNYEIKQGQNILVYMAFYQKDNLIEILSKRSDQQFIVYGFNIDEEIKNITFKKTSRDGFLRDLTSCKAIISNAGFNLTWEAFLIKKFMWTIPLKNHFEQQTNAQRLKDLGRSYVSQSFNSEHLDNFLNWLNEIKSLPVSKMKIYQAADILNQSYEYIAQYRLKHRKISWSRVKKEIEDEKKVKKESKSKREIIA